MSLSLVWVPIVPQDLHSLPYALKSILSENRDWYDGFRGTVRRVAVAEDIPYLSGLRDAKVDGAQELIDAIEKWGAVQVFTES